MIRTLTSRDLNQVMEIWLHTSIESHPFIDKNYFLHNYQTFMEQQLTQHKSYVYEIEGTVAGFISIAENMFIVSLNVDSAYQEKGIGEALLDHALEKYQQLSVNCYVENAKAADFFLENGFEIVGKTRNEKTHQEEYVMVYEQTPESRN